MNRQLSVSDEVHVHDGPDEQRLDADVHAGAAIVIGAVLGVRVTITTHLWIQWARIALEREPEAREARRKAEQVQDQSGYFAELLGREFAAALVAVAASAFAIDAFYGAIKPLIQIPAEKLETWSKNKTPRNAQVFETLKIGCAIGKAGMPWAKELEWLFDLRDKAVHFGEESQEPQPHPIGTRVAVEQIDYSFESARRAVDLLMEILETCSRTPRASLPRVVAHMATLRPEVERMLAAQSHDKCGSTTAEGTCSEARGSVDSFRIQ